MKFGRPPLPPDKANNKKRVVSIAQMDFAKLELAYQIATGDPSKSIWDASGKLSSSGVSEILELFVVMAEERGEKKSAELLVAPTVGDSRATLLKDPLFHHAVVLCGANSFGKLADGPTVFGIFSLLS